nr:hypothetical protein [uncultured Carboxylicivirga sp.]
MSQVDQSVAGQLSSAKVMILNAQTHEKIKLYMADMGYDDESLKQGESLLNVAMEKAQSSELERLEKSESHKLWLDALTDTTILYKQLRKKAKAVFRKDPFAMSQLDLMGDMPNAYLKVLSVIRTFTSGLLAKEEWMLKIQRLKVTKEEVELLHAKVEGMATLRASYYKEKGESENATQVRDQALADLEDWKHDFKAVARIAMEDEPQLLEVLGIMVK